VCIAIVWSFQVSAIDLFVLGTLVQTSARPTPPDGIELVGQEVQISLSPSFPMNLATVSFPSLCLAPHITKKAPVATGTTKALSLLTLPQNSNFLPG
jgi:hypothetical protein